MIVADDTAEIDLKCEEKVTDSDVEESNFDSEDNQTNIKVHVCLSLTYTHTSFNKNSIHSLHFNTMLFNY